MPANEFARRSDGFLAVCDAPDHCKTPPGDTPVPYQVQARLDQAVSVSPDVRYGGLPVVLADASAIPAVTGNESGSGGGVKSGVNKGKVAFVAGAATVRANGKRMVRHQDPVTLNDCNTTGKVLAKAGPSAGGVGPAGRVAQDPHVVEVPRPLNGPLSEGNQNAIRILQPLANDRAGQPGEVLVLIWDWESGGVIGPDHSVGHVAAAVKNAKGNWEIILSQFPHELGGESAVKGPNTTIARPMELFRAEGRRKPNSAFLVKVEDLGAFAKMAIRELQKSIWFFRPINGNQTNCTVAVLNSLKAAGVAWTPYMIIRVPRDVRVFLGVETQYNVIHKYKVYRRDRQIGTIQWKE